MSESQLIEYKESWRDEYLKWICGFANAQGGVLYIGKRDDGSVCGVADSKKLMEDIPNKVRDALGLIVDVDLITENGLDVIKITVEENPYPVNYKGEYHYRTGSTKQLLQGSALTNFLLRKTGKNWDSVPLENVGVNDLDKESFDIFHREAIFNALIHQDFSVGVPVQISMYKDKLYISNVSRIITELKTTGTIARVGSDKTGHWMINQSPKNSTQHQISQNSTKQSAVFP